MGLSDFCSDHFSEEELESLWICSLVASLLSVVGSSFMLENFFLYDKGRDMLPKLVAWLAFGDYLGAVNNVISSLILLYKPHLYTWGVCVVMRSWFHIVTGTTWCYTSVIAFFLYRFMMTRNPSWVGWRTWVVFHLMSWGIPIAGVVVMIAGNFIYQSEYTGLCYPTQLWHIILWFVPIIISFVWMLFCYASIFWKVFRLRNEQCESSLASESDIGSVSLEPVPHTVTATLFADEKKERKSLLTIVLRFSFYILVFFICWFFDIVTNFILFFNEDCSVYGFTIVYTLFRNMQGLFDCLVYGLTNLKIRKRFTKSILSAVVSLWELLLSPALVLPAFIAYARQTLQPYFDSNKSEKIFVSINEELMKEKRHKFRRKVPARYFKQAVATEDTTAIHTQGNWEQEQQKHASHPLGEGEDGDYEAPFFGAIVDVEASPKEEIGKEKSVDLPVAVLRHYLIDEAPPDEDNTPVLAERGGSPEQAEQEPSAIRPGSQDQ